MQNLLDELKILFSKDDRLVVDGVLMKNKVIELALHLDPTLIKTLLSHSSTKKHFFQDIGGVLVFDKIKFQQFVSNKAFLPDSYTEFKNKVGLIDERGDYISERKDVALVWPYKDCVLEGGQTKEEQKREEIFWNETLAPDEIDRLLERKVLTNFKKYDGKGEHTVADISLDDNFIIKGNNLLVLHSLKKTHRGKIKLIYIDPPYNLGGDSFQYNDRFNHSTWLTFMRNRLQAARSLLRSDGAIFIQIDYKEVGYLIVLMNEIFGRDNFIQLISVKTASPAGFKTVNPGPIDVTEYILFYTKSKPHFQFKKMYVPTDYDKNYNLLITNLDQKPDKWKLVPLRDIIYKENGVELGKSPQATAKNAKNKWGPYWKVIRDQLMAEYALANADKVVSIRDPHKPTAKLKELMEKSKESRDKVLVYEKADKGNSEEEAAGYIINGGALSFYSNKVKEIEGNKTPTELLTDLWNDISWDGIAKEGGVKLKNGKKPERLIKRIIELGTNSKNDIVLDFYLGSGTTCAVAHKLGQKYIGIEQLDYEDNDSLVRLKNVISGDPSGISKSVNWTKGGSFIYCELATTNEKFIIEIQSAKTAKELKSIWAKMQEKAFISYKVDIKAINENADSFDKLSIEDQKKFLVEVLDKNLLYVNLSDIEDKDYKISKEDKALNQKFYSLK